MIFIDFYRLRLIFVDIDQSFIDIDRYKYVFQIRVLDVRIRSDFSIVCSNFPCGT